jgi:hypothetical protein
MVLRRSLPGLRRHPRIALPHDERRLQNPWRLIASETLGRWLSFYGGSYQCEINCNSRWTCSLPSVDARQAILPVY